MQHVLQKCCAIHHVATYCNRMANHAQHLARYIVSITLKCCVRLTRLLENDQPEWNRDFFSLNNCFLPTSPKEFFWEHLREFSFGHQGFFSHFILKWLIYLADIGPLLSQVTPTRSKSSSTRRKSLQREQAEKPVKPAVPGGEPITLDMARVTKT